MRFQLLSEGDSWGRYCWSRSAVDWSSTLLVSPRGFVSHLRTCSFSNADHTPEGRSCADIQVIAEARASHTAHDPPFPIVTRALRCVPAMRAGEADIA